MSSKFAIRFSKKKIAMIVGAICSVGGHAATASAQDESNSAAPVEEILITGYKGALLNSTNAKRESIGFSDEVFADDLGKMPSQNLAESLSRIPGVKINRDVTGEGQQISVRGLGSSFTKVVLNGNAMSVASMGDMNVENGDGRQVNLDLFSPELFRSLSVDKAAKASQLEGGVSGYVNLRTLRASDLGEGHTVKASASTVYKDTTEAFSPKLSLTYGYSEEKFGVLAAIVHQSNEHGIDGYEVIGNVEQKACLGATDSNGCANGEGSPIRYSNIATADYVADHPGTSVGDIVDLSAQADTLAAMDLPYIARLASTRGEKESLSGLLSFEYTPSEDVTAALDILHADVDNDFTRDELMYIYRRNYDFQPIPQDIQLDQNGHLSSGTFYGASLWSGSRNYDEATSFTSIMPSVEWQINDIFKMDASASRTKSEFSRYNPYGLMFTAPGTLRYSNDDIAPTVTHSGADNFADYTTIDGEDRIRAGHTERETKTSGVHIDFTVGDDPERNGFKFGLHLDKMDATRNRFNPVFGSQYDANNDDNVTMNEYLYGIGAVDELNNNISNYVRRTEFGDNFENWNGMTTFGSTNWGAVKELIGFNNWNEEIGSFTNISEDVFSWYVEANTETEVIGRSLRMNGGMRLVATDQFVEDQTGSTEVDYDRVLPSFSAVYDVYDNVKLRASSSRSLTRANPSDMFPGSSWDGSGIDVVRVGNPGLAPFESTNFDIGGEWYFSELGYVGFTYYTKDITGFTYQDTILENLNDLGNYGVDLTTLSATQEEAREICDPNCEVQVVTRVNTREASTIKGYEIIWVQPLDMWVEGLGFNATYNNIKDDSPEGAEITNIADSFNATVYFENEDFQTRLTVNKQDGAKVGDIWGFPVESRDRTQLDFSASYNLPWRVENNITLMFDAYNLTNEPQSTRFVYDGVVPDSQSYDVYYPGSTYTFGVQATF